jgi:hypothetical protein
VAAGAVPALPSDHAQEHRRSDYVARVAARGARVERWDDIPPMSAGYGASRDAIVERVKKLLDELAPAAPR